MPSSALLRGVTAYTAMIQKRKGLQQKRTQEWKFFLFVLFHIAILWLYWYDYTITEEMLYFSFENKHTMDFGDYEREGF